VYQHKAVKLGLSLNLDAPGLDLTAPLPVATPLESTATNAAAAQGIVKYLSVGVPEDMRPGVTFESGKATLPSMAYTKPVPD
jgi:hypothetical protein